MYMQRSVETMHLQCQYEDVVADTIKNMAVKLYALRNLGVSDIILDPGFGFSKTVEQNYELFVHLDDFQIFEMPLLVGISRKYMIWRKLEITPENALNGTTALHMMALDKGADILRVHDVKEAVETVKLFMSVKKYQQTN